MPRGLATLLLSLLLSGCAELPKFEDGWQDRLPSRRIELAVFVYPWKGAGPSSVSEWEATSLGASISSQLERALDAQGLKVSTRLRSLRADHMWLWRDQVNAGALDEPLPEQATLVQKGDRILKKRYVEKLRTFAEQNPDTTIVFVCMHVARAAYFSQPYGGTGSYTETYSGNVLYRAASPHDGRCSSQSSVVAIGKELSVVALSDFPVIKAVKFLKEKEDSTSIGTRYRELSLSEWSSEISASILKTIRLESRDAIN